MEKSYHFPVLEAPELTSSDDYLIYRAFDTIPDHVLMNVIDVNIEDVGERFDATMKIKEIVKNKTIQIEPEELKTLAIRIRENGFYENPRILWGETSTNKQAIKEMEQAKAEAETIVADLVFAVLSS